MRSFFIIFIFSVVFYSLAVLKTGSIVWGDSLYYMAYTHSLVVDHDLDLSNEASTFPNPVEVSTITGKVINKFSQGTAILWIPSFIIGYLLQLFIDASFGFQLMWLPMYMTAIFSIGFSVSGLFLVYKMMLFFFSKSISSLTVVFLYFTTQMFYYTSIDPLNSHSASFLVSSLLLYLVVSYLRTKLVTSYHYAVLGFLSGLLVLIRNQDVVIILPLFLYFFFHINEVWQSKLKKSLVFIGTAFLMVSIQLFITLELFGMFGSPYLIRGEQLNWLHPNFMRVLFSFGNGLFAFAPILLVSVIGLMMRSNKSKLKNMSKVALVIFLLQLFVVASWGAEIIGGPYGSRMFISILPYLMLGLANVLQRLEKTTNFYSLVYLSISILFTNNLVQIGVMLYRF